MRGSSRVLVAGAAAVLFAAASAVAGEPSAADRETSRALYAQGMQSLDAHDYAAAERACGGAHALVRAPTSAACWARALEGLGRLIEARDEFLEAAHFPASADEPGVFSNARTLSRAEADRLAKRIPTVTLIVQGPSDPSRLRVNIDGASVAVETALLPRKVNPGPHSVTVVSRGFEPTTVDVSVAEAEDRRVEVTLHAIEAQPSAAKASPVPGSEPATTAGTAGVRAPPTSAIVAGSIGFVGLVMGVATGLAATSKHSTLSGECSGNTCPPSARGDLDSFHSLRTWSTVGYLLGGLGIAGGAVLWLIAPPAPSSGPTIGVWLGPTSTGLSGAF